MDAYSFFVDRDFRGKIKPPDQTGRLALDIFVTGRTGYMGTRLISTLLARGHRVRALARQTSLGRVPEGATPVVGDALDAESVAATLRSTKC